MRTRSVRIGVCASGRAPLPLRAYIPHPFPFHIFAAPPPTPPPKGEKGRKEMWCGLFRHYGLQKVSFKAPLNLRAFHSTFLRPCGARGAPVARVHGNASVHSHCASTSHRPLTFVRDACSVLASCSLSGFGGVRGSSLCLPNPPSARTN